jgi:hypothetical protein
VLFVDIDSIDCTIFNHFWGGFRSHDFDNASGDCGESVAALFIGLLYVIVAVHDWSPMAAS